MHYDAANAPVLEWAALQAFKIQDRRGFDRQPKRDSMPTPLVVPRLAKSERNIAIFDHVLDLPPQSQACQEAPIDNQHGPKDRHVENSPPRAEESDGDRPGTAVPKFEFRQPPYERAKLFVLFCGQCGLRCVAIFKAFVLGQGWVEFRLQEREEEI